MLKRQIAVNTKSSGINTDLCWNEYQRAAPFLQEFLNGIKSKRADVGRVERAPLLAGPELAAA